MAIPGAADEAVQGCTINRPGIGVRISGCEVGCLCDAGMRHADVGQTLRNIQASRQIIKAKRRIGLPQSPGNALHRLRRGRVL